MGTLNESLAAEAQALSPRRDYTISEIISMSKEDMWQLPLGGLRIQFKDKQVKTLTKYVQVNWFWWQLFAYNNQTNITSDYFFGPTSQEDLDKFKNKQPHNFSFNDGIPASMLTKCFWASWELECNGFHPGVGLDLIWSMSRRAYQIMNELFNATNLKMGEYVSTLDMSTIVDIILDPYVVENKRKFENGEISISENYKLNTEYIKTNPKFYHNGISQGIRPEVYGSRAINQSLFPRGYIPEINGVAQRVPIYESYGEGFMSNYDRIIESATASIANFYTKEPLKISEYNNRQAQFVVSPISHVTHADCGTHRTVDYYVKDKLAFKQILQKFHMVDGKYECITPDRTDLIGQRIKLRDIHCCESGDPTSPCIICLGKSGLTVPPRKNLGIHLTFHMLSSISQKTMSVKHMLASTKPLFLNLSSEESEFVYLDPEEPANVILKKPVFTNVKQSLRFNRSEVLFINDIFGVDDIRELNYASTTAVETIMVCTYKNDTLSQVDVIDTRISNIGSPLTPAMLQYIKQKNWTQVGDAIEVEMDEWDYSLAVVETPRRSADLLAPLRAFQDFTFNRDGLNAVRAKDFKNASKATQALIDVMSPYLFIHYNQAEIFTKAITSRVDENGYPTYELPLTGEPFTFVDMRQAILNGDIYTTLAYERIPSVITDPSFYNKLNRRVGKTNMGALWGRS